MHQLYPYLGSVWEPRTLSQVVTDVPSARGIPGVGRALDLYRGLIATCALTRVSAGRTSSTRFLSRPDPDMGPSAFVGAHVDDYLLDGNALHLVTLRDRTGWPAAVRWFPSTMWGVVEERPGIPSYFLNGNRVDRDDVVHVARPVRDPMHPWRGLGVVEQHLRTLQRSGLQEAAESENLRSRGMPAVAVIAPNQELDETAVDAAADKWVERFTGPEPRPGIFPKDTQIIPIAWNPEQGQMVQARGMTTKDIANAFNLDGYWLGAEGSSHTYRSPGPLFLSLLKTALNPVMRAFEEEWGFQWLPYGTELRFDRSELLRDDLLTMVQAFTTGATYFPDKNEPRRLMGLPEVEEWPEPPVPPAAPVPVPDDPAEDDPAEDDEEGAA